MSTSTLLDERVVSPRRGGWWTPRTALIASILAFALFASMPYWLFTSDYSIGLLLQIAIYSAFGLSWHLLAGYSGQYSFGHAVFFGSGAYAMSILSYRYDVSPWLGLGAGAVAAAVVGLTVGLIAIRLSGLFFGLVTFGTALMLGVLATHFVDLTGGAAGMSLPLRVGQTSMMQFDSQVPMFHLALFLVGAYLAITVVILRSRLGLRFKAVRDDPAAAEASGLPTRKVRLVATVISAAMAGLVGAVYAQSLLFIDPESAFGMNQSVNAIFTAIIGGMGTVAGPVLGAAVFVLLREFGNTVSDGDGVYSVLFYSSVVFVFIILAPKGLAGIGRWAIDRVSRGRRDS